MKPSFRKSARRRWFTGALVIAVVSLGYAANSTTTPVLAFCDDQNNENCYYMCTYGMPAEDDWKDECDGCCGDMYGDSPQYDTCSAACYAPSGKQGKPPCSCG